MPTTRSILLDIEERREGNALAAAGKDMRKLADETEHTEDRFKLFEKDMRNVQTEIEKSTTKVTELRKEIARTGDTNLFGDLRKEEANARRLQNLAKGLKADLEKTLEVSGGGFFSSLQGAAPGPNGMAALGAGLVGLVAAAAAPLGAMIAGAVAGTVGTGGIVGGVLAASHDPQVKSAFASLVEDVKKEFFEAGSSFIQPTVDAVETLKQAFGELDLGKTFALAAPDLKIIVDGLVQLLKNVMPGLNTLLARSKPFAEAAARGFAYLGTSISEFLDNVSASPGAIQGLESLFIVLGGVIKALGVTLRWLSDQFHTFNNNLAEVSSAVSHAIKFLGGQGGFTDWLDRGTNNLRALGAQSDRTATSTRHLAEDIQFQVGGLKRLNAEMANTIDLLSKALGLSLSLDEASLGVTRAFMDMKTALDENGKSWNANNDAAVREREAFLAAIDDLQRLRDAQIASGMSMKDANANYDAGVEALLKLAGQAGATKAQLDQLKGTYEINIMINAILGALGNVASIAQRVGPKLRFAAGGTVPGPVGAPQLAVVHGGEQVLTPRQQAYIMPSAGGQAPPVVISFASTGDALFDAFLRELRKHVRINGGSADLAFS